MTDEDNMTDEEHIALVSIGDSFYDKLGALVAEHIAVMPMRLESVTLEHLQGKCSVYSVDYSGPLKALRRER